MSDADQAALLALAHVGRRAPRLPAPRCWCRAELEGGSVDLTYEVRLGQRRRRDPPRRRTRSGPASAGPGRLAAADADERRRSVDDEDELDGEQVRTILSDTLVETPDMVAVFASVGREALWANDAFVTLIPIREADKIWLVELLDEWSRGSLRGQGPARAGEVRALAGSADLRLRRRAAAHVGGDGGPPRHQRRHRPGHRWWPATCPSCGTPRSGSAATETRLAALVENAADLIVVVDPDGTIRYLSPAVSRTLGHDAGRARRGRPHGAGAPRRRPDRPAGAGPARRAGHRLAGRAAGAARARARGATSR